MIDRYRFIILYVLVLIVNVTMVSSIEKNDFYHNQAIRLLVDQKYDSAQSQLTTAIGNDSFDLKAIYLSFAVEQTRILEYESYLTEQKKFQKLGDSIKPIFEKRIKSLKGKDSIACLFYIANIYAGIGIMQAKTGNWFDGVKNALTSISLLKQVKKNDSTFYAADLGIGTFNYYLSTGFKWLPFIENKEKEGFDAVERSLLAEYPYNYAAKNSLCWILIERKQFNRADSIARTVLNESPDNTIFLRIRAMIALWTGKYEIAEKIGYQLLRLNEKRTPLNWSDLISGYAVIVQSMEEQGRYREACVVANNFSNYKIPKSHLDIPHLKKNVKYVAGVVNRCKNDQK